MLRIGVTQRVARVESYGERRDCLDQRWGDLLELLGMLCLPLANRPDNADVYMDALALDGVILSGGNNISTFAKAADEAPERDAFERKVLEWSARRKIPVLGVCRGMQMINLFCGGDLAVVNGHVACRHPLRQPDVNPVWRGIESVNSYHNFSVMPSGLGTNLKPLAWTDDQAVEAFQHHERPWHGIMWHPERETPFTEMDMVYIRSVFKG